MTEPKAPKIEFPCADYPIRIMGAATDDFHKVVLDIVKKHAPDHDGSHKLRDSRNGRFVSVLVSITATGEEQLGAMYQELKDTGRVLMVL